MILSFFHIFSFVIDSLNIKTELLKQENIIDNNFVLSKKVDISTNGWSTIKLLNKNKRFIYQKGKIYSKTHKFSDIISYEVYENEKNSILEH